MLEPIAQARLGQSLYHEHIPPSHVLSGIEEPARMNSPCASEGKESITSSRNIVRDMARRNTQNLIFKTFTSHKLSDAPQNVR